MRLSTPHLPPSPLAKGERRRLPKADPGASLLITNSQRLELCIYAASSEKPPKGGLQTFYNVAPELVAAAEQARRL